MRSTDFLLQVGSGVGAAGIDRYGRTKLAGKVELGVFHIDCRDVQAHRPGVLDGHVPETADTGDHDPVARPGPRHLQALVHGNAREQDWRDLDEVHIGGQLVGIGDHILGEGAVNRIPAVLLRLAQRFPAGPTVGAVTAGGVQPRYADPVALAHVRHPVLKSKRSACLTDILRQTFTNALNIIHFSKHKRGTKLREQEHPTTIGFDMAPSAARRRSLRMVKLSSEAVSLRPATTEIYRARLPPL
jgi:hypothetical protein